MDDAGLRIRAWAGVAAQQRLFGEHAPGASVFEGRGWIASLVPSAPDSALLNVAVPVEPGIVAPVDDLRRLFAPSEVRWGMWVDGSGESSDAGFQAHGLQVVSTCRLMARELTRLAERANDDVEPTDDLGFVGALNDRAYRLTDGRLERHFGAIVSGSVHAHRIGRRSVAAAVDHDGDASLFFVATGPEARGRGLATTVVKATLAAARDRGCTTASLLATPDGAGLYARLGFRDLGPARLWATPATARPEAGPRRPARRSR